MAKARFVQSPNLGAKMAFVSSVKRRSFCA
jgi:hypothetical protein